jgi:regulator of protease activity HflC (stomatin/prohibitin superfamily)
MSLQPNPPKSPLDALMREAAKQMEKKLGDWQKQAEAARNTDATGSKDARQGAAELQKAREKLRAFASGSGGGGASGGGGSPPPTPPKKSALGETDSQKFFKWMIGIGIALFVLSLIGDVVKVTFGVVGEIVKSIVKGISRESPNLPGDTLQSFQGINWESVMGSFFSSLVPIAIFIVAIIFVVKAIRVVPQQRAYVIERLGRYHATLEPGLRFTIPFVDRISAKHDLREVPLDVPSQVCITKDNTQLQVDGILYYQVTDAKLATYGSSNFIMAITQLAQTTLRSVVGKLELDKTFEERDMINHAVVNALDEAAMNWGVKVLRYEIKDLTPPKEILHAMQAQITAEREKRALIAASEGRKQEQINIAMGQKEAAIAKSEGDKISDINQAQGEAAAILAKAEANAEAIRKIAMAIESQGGLQAVNLKVAEQYVAALSNIAREGNTIVVPQNLTDIASLVTTATSVLKASK